MVVTVSIKSNPRSTAVVVVGITVDLKLYLFFFIFSAESSYHGSTIATSFNMHACVCVGYSCEKWVQIREKITVSRIRLIIITEGTLRMIPLKRKRKKHRKSGSIVVIRRDEFHRTL